MCENYTSISSFTSVTWATSGAGGVMLRGKCGVGDGLSVFGFNNPASRFGFIWEPKEPSPKGIALPMPGIPGSWVNGGTRRFEGKPEGSESWGATEVGVETGGMSWSFSSVFGKSSLSFGPLIPAFSPFLAISSLWCRSWWTFRLPRHVDA